MSTTTIENPKQFKKTTIHLGKSKQAHIIKTKAKFKPPESGFCKYCFLTVEMTIYGNCKICNSRIVRRTTHETMIKKFKVICNANQSALNHFIFDGYENDGIVFPISFGQKTLLVPIRYLQAFENIEHSDQSKHDAYNAFFSHLRNNCMELKGWK